MNFDNLINHMAEIFSLANTPTYIYRNIVDTFTNIDLKDISETEINEYEKSLKKKEDYMLYLLIYIKIKKGYRLDENIYKDLKWHEEFISYCRSKQMTLSSFRYVEDENTSTMKNEYTIITTNKEHNIDASL